MSGKPRPRRDCPVCGRKTVAVLRSGHLYWHKRPGWGLWSDGGDCQGERLPAALAKWEASRAVRQG